MQDPTHEILDFLFCYKMALEEISSNIEERIDSLQMKFSLMGKIRFWQFFRFLEARYYILGIPQLEEVLSLIAFQINSNSELQCSLIGGDTEFSLKGLVAIKSVLRKIREIEANIVAQILLKTGYSEEDLDRFIKELRGFDRTQYSF